MGMQESSHPVEGREQPGSQPVARREFFTAAAVAGAGLVIAGTGTLEAAQDTAHLGLTATADKLDYNEAEVRLLTPGVKRLTIQDLHEMREEWFKDPTRSGAQFLAQHKTKGGLTATVEDITSLHKANSARYERIHNAKGYVSVSCCCCSPCCSCCAGVVTEPLVTRAA